MTMPTTAVAAASNCRARPPGEDARRSPKTTVPMTTPETGSTVSMMGRLIRRAPAWYALTESSSPTAPRTISTHGCQLERTAVTPWDRSSLDMLSVTAAVMPMTTPAAMASREARADGLLSSPAVTAAAAMSATTAKASSQSSAAASDRPCC